MFYSYQITHERFILGFGSTEKTLLSILEWIIAFLFIQYTGSIWFSIDGSFLWNYSHLFRVLLYLAAIILVLYSISKRREVRLSEVVSLTVLFGSIVLTAVSSSGFLRNAFINFYAPAISGILMGLFLQVDNIKNILMKFYRLMLIIAATSLVFWVFGTVLKIITPNDKVWFNWGEMKGANSYWRVFFEPRWQAVKVLGRTIYKNCGIFAEPPMYGFLLGTAYSVYRLFDNSSRLIKALLIVTIITTMNTTAIIYLMVFELCIYFFNKRIEIVSLVRLLIGICFFVVGTILALTLVLKKFASGSGMVRLDHLAVSWTLWNTNPLLGVGIGNHDAFTRLEHFKQGMSIGLPAFLQKAVLAVYC